MIDKILGAYFRYKQYIQYISNAQLVLRVFLDVNGEVNDVFYEAIMESPEAA